MQQKVNRVGYFDILNTLAAIFVVWIHFGNGFHGYRDTIDWQWCLFIQVVCFWAVPVFFMLTGATLMEYNNKYSTAEFFKRRIQKTLVPYLIFGIIAIIFYWSRGGVQINWQHPVISVLDIFMNNRMESIYWFLPVLFGIYVAMPALSVFSVQENRKHLDYLVCTGVLTISALPFFAQALQQFGGVSEYCWNDTFSIPMLGGYLIYPVLGYWASTHNFSKRERVLCYLAGIGSAILRFWGLKYLCQRDRAINPLFMDYRSIHALFLALSVFVFFKSFCQNHPMPEWLGHFLRELSSCNFGVYLIHYFVITLMWEHNDFFAKPLFGWFFFWPFVCYAFCAVLVFCAKTLWKQAWRKKKLPL